MAAIDEAVCARCGRRWRGRDKPCPTLLPSMVPAVEHLMEVPVSAIAAALDEDRDDFFWETIMVQKAAMGGGAIGTASAAIAYVRRALLGTEEETT